MTTPTPPTATLADFLLARIAEDEEAIRFRIEREGGESALGRHSTLRRRLIGCEAKRRIVDLVAGRPNDWGAEQASRLLAAVYSDHPDYRQEWKP